MVIKMEGWEFGMGERVRLKETGKIFTVVICNSNNSKLEQRYYVGVPREPHIWADPEELEHLPKTKIRKKGTNRNGSS